MGGSYSSKRKIVVTNEEQLQLSPFLMSKMREMESDTKSKQDTDEYWERRYENMKATQERAEQIAALNCREAYKKISKQYKAQAPAGTPAPCTEYKDLVIECYKQHPNETIHCFNVVQDFMQCVHDYRFDPEYQNEICDENDDNEEPDETRDEL